MATPLPPVVPDSPLSILGPRPILTTYINLVVASITLYYYSDIDPSLRPVDTPTSGLLQEYDFVIIGAGTAGSTLANRLTEVPSWKVLLLEAGGDETAVSDTPFLTGALWYTDQDWNYTTTQQARACRYDNEGRCRWPRGRGLGGSSTINAMLYVRGNPTDYESWGPGWSYPQLLPYFLRAEDNRIPSLYSSPYHRTGGYQTVSQAYTTSVASLFLEAGQQMGYDVLDYNGAVQTGFGIAQVTIRDGSRCSTAKGYLRPIRNRPNLHIAQRAMVSKILIDSQNKTAYGVQFFRDGNQLHTVTASREVLVSAGSINTPQLLMLSGVGPTQELERFGLPVIQNLPVGKNLHDHLGVPLVFSVQGASVINTAFFANISSVLDYAVNQTGPLTSLAGYEVLGFLDSNNSRDSPPDIQFHCGGWVPSRDPEAQLIEIIAQLLHPRSRGQITLQSSSPLDPPLINPNYLEDPADMAVLVRAIELGFAMSNTPVMISRNVTFQSQIYQACNNTEPGSQAFAQCAILNYSGTIFHPVGTCRMGASSDPRSVVSNDLQVLGINGLRVVDASIIPAVTSGNINAPTITIAERASDIIKLYWNETIGVLNTTGFQI